MKNDCKLKIVYSEDGTVVSDFKAINWVDNKIQEFLNSSLVTSEIRIGTEHMLNIFVLRVMEDIIPASDIQFYYENIPLDFNKYDGIILPENCPAFGWATVTMQIIKLGYTNLTKEEGVHK